MERKRYDQPGEAAEHWASRRRSEGEAQIQPEWYLAAVEKARDLAQFSTLLNRSFSSQREMAKAGLNASNPKQEMLQTWTPLGPGNVGGRTRALLVNPKTPEVMYAAAVSGGVWKTTDAGRNWRPLTDLLPTLAFGSLAFDPQNPEIIYAGTGEGYFNADAMRGAGIFRSFDGGTTWRQLEGTRTAAFYYVNDIVVSPKNSSRIYAATRNGVMRSLDGGSSWTQVITDQPSRFGGCSDLAIRTDRDTDFMFAACGMTTNFRNPGATRASIYRTENAAAGLGGWESVLSEPGMARTSLAIAPSNQNVIYAVSSENGEDGMAHTLHAVFRSVDGGALDSWAKVNNAHATTKLNGSLFTNPYFAFRKECQNEESKDYAQGWFDNVIAVDPLNENTVWVGGIDLFRSDDGGANWGMASFWDQSKTNAKYVHADHHAIVFHPQFNGGSNRTMFVGTDGGIFRTENARAQTATGNRAPCSPNSSGVTWASLNNGYAVTQFYHGAAFPGGTRYLAGAQDNGTVMGSDAGGIDGWREILDGDGGYVAVDPTNPNIVYAEATGLSLMKSTDGGANFRPATTNINNDGGFGFIVPFVLDPNDPTRLWLGGTKLWRTRNGADTWTLASGGLNGKTTAIAVSQNDGNFVVAGTDQGYVYRTTTGLSSNGDAGWAGTQPRGGTVSALAFDPTNRDNIYATYTNFGGKHVYRSLNGGVDWQSIDGNLPDIPVNCIIVDPTNPQRLYIGTDIGVFTSLDAGATWAVENTGFANAPVEWLSVNSVGGTAHLFAFTRGRGAWRTPLGQVQPCSFTLSPTGQPMDSIGGAKSVEVTASNLDCEWTVENIPAWITIASQIPIRGSAALAYTVAANAAPEPRTATMTVAGIEFTVIQAGRAVSVSAASLTGQVLAPESIVTAFGLGLADSTQTAPGNQLPTNLAGTVLKVRDQSGAERPIPLFFVSPNQINYQLPIGLAAGPASVMIYKGSDKVFSCQIQVSKVAPGLFTADGTGRGAPAGQALRYRPSVPNSAPQSEPLFLTDSNQRTLLRPIDLGADLGANSDQVFLVLYGTGFRHRSSLANVAARIGTLNLPAQFVGAQGGFAGLDQINVLLPRTLAGRGEVELALIVDGQQSNVVRISIK
ncbi:MAG: hypothetical protein ACKVZH_28435 [Blastocatellia bacterium]